MKRLILLLFTIVIGFAESAVAQSIALDDRVPRIKKGIAWLGGIEPVAADFTFIHFCSTKSEDSIRLISELHALQQQSAGRFTVVVIGRESTATLLPLVTDYLSPHFTAIADPERKIFDDYDVYFAPFGFLINSKRRTIWMGNPTQELDTITEKIK